MTYDNIKNRVASNFWGSPVIAQEDGTLTCPGFTGDTYSKRIWDSVKIQIPTQYLAQGMLGQTPGICEVTCVKERDVDKKKLKGSDGARITLAGLEPATVEIKISIWTPQQLLMLERLRPIIFPGPQKKTTNKTENVTRTDSSIRSVGDTVAPNADTVTRTAQPAFVTIPTTQKKVVSKTTRDVTTTQPFTVTHPALSDQNVSAIVFVKCTGPEPGRAPNVKVYTFHAIEHSLPKKGINATTTMTGAVAKGSTLDDTSNPTPGQVPGNLDP